MENPQMERTSPPPLPLPLLSSFCSLATLGRLLPFIERKKGKRARGKKDVSNAISQGRRRLRGCLLFSTWLCALLVASIP